MISADLEAALVPVSAALAAPRTDAGAAVPIGREGRQLSQVAASYVRDLLMSGRVAGGEYLRPAQLAADLGISVTPVREALLRLCAENFVALAPHRGFIAVDVRAEDIVDLFQAQAFVAGELAARAARVVTATGLAELHAVQADLEEAVERGRTAEVQQLNFDFHRRINHLPQAPKLEWVLRSIVRYMPRRYFADIGGWEGASVQDHRAILAALVVGDSEQARVHVQEHIRHAGDLLVAHLAQGPTASERAEAPESA